MEKCRTIQHEDPDAEVVQDFGETGCGFAMVADAIFRATANFATFERADGCAFTNIGEWHPERVLKRLSNGRNEGRLFGCFFLNKRDRALGRPEIDKPVR